MESPVHRSDTVADRLWGDATAYRYTCANIPTHGNTTAHGYPNSAAHGDTRSNGYVYTCTDRYAGTDYSPPDGDTDPDGYPYVGSTE